MRCEEVQSLHGPYLDSELDARTSLEIEQHLKSCPDCARLFAEEQKLEARLKAGLTRGSRTPALWEQIERAVLRRCACAARSRRSGPGLRSLPGGRLCSRRSASSSRPGCGVRPGPGPGWRWRGW